MQYQKPKEIETYKISFTNLFFEKNKQLEYARNYPTIDNIKAVYSAIRSLLISLTQPLLYDPKKHLETLNDIESILYGSPSDKNVLDLCNKYNIRFNVNVKTRKVGIENAQILLRELEEIFLVIKKWAREQDLFAREPEEEMEDEISGYE